MLEKSKIILLAIILITIGVIGFVVFLNINSDENKISDEDVMDQNIMDEYIMDEYIIDKYIIDEISKSENKNPREIIEEIENSYNNLEDYSEGSEYVVRDRVWQSSGPFSIDRYSYSLGEKIFLRASGLSLDEKGTITFLRKSNSTHYTVWKTYDFDGSVRESFNVYFDPVLSKFLGLCSKNDLIGEWTIVFKNTNYKNLPFEINEIIVPGDERKYNQIVC